MRHSTLFVMIVVCSTMLAAQVSVRVKEWRSGGARGEVTLELTSLLPKTGKGQTVLSFDSADDTVASTAEGARLLSQALDEMPSLGYDPRKVLRITISLDKSEYREGVERSVAESGKWKACVGLKYCHAAEGIANRYLESVDAFKAFDDALRMHGLVRRSVSVDDMIVGRQPNGVSCSTIVHIAVASKE